VLLKKSPFNLLIEASGKQQQTTNSDTRRDLVITHVPETTMTTIALSLNQQQHLMMSIGGQES